MLNAMSLLNDKLHALSFNYFETSKIILTQNWHTFRGENDKRNWPLFVCTFHGKYFNRQVQNSTLVFIGHVPDILRGSGKTSPLTSTLFKNEKSELHLLKGSCIIKNHKSKDTLFLSVRKMKTNYAFTCQYTISIRHLSVVQFTENKMETIWKPPLF
jgi:hypothetical protein